MGQLKIVSYSAGLNPLFDQSEWSYQIIFYLLFKITVILRKDSLNYLGKYVNRYSLRSFRAFFNLFCLCDLHQVNVQGMEWLTEKMITKSLTNKLS